MKHGNGGTTHLSGGSTELVHVALIDPRVFARAQEIATAGRHRPTETRRRPTTRKYLLSGLVRCAVCGRRMEGAWVNGQPYYRCRFPRE